MPRIGDRPATDGGWRAVVLAAVLAIALASPAIQSPVAITMHAPTRDYMVRAGYLVSWNGMARCARWVLERHEPGEASLEVPRENASWRADREIPSEFAPDLADYDGSGYDRGHLAAAEDQDQDESRLWDSFLASNAVPEVPYLNRGVWRSIEAETRKLIRGDGVRAVWVLTAPAWLPQGYAESRKLGLRSMYYFPAMGKSRIWVPTHITRTVLVEKRGGEHQALAWIVPNREDVEKDPKHWRVSVDDWERAVGLDAWAALPDSIETKLESQ